MRITLYLYREGIPLAKDRLRQSARYEEVPLREPDGDDLRWRFFYQQRPQQPVRWLSHVQPIFRDTVAPVTLFGQSAGAVLLVAAHDRLWAVTFGTGYHAVDPSEFELKVAANSVNPARMTLAETRGLDKGTRNAISSLSVPNRMFALRVATNEEWVRRFGGKVANTSFAVSVSGADSLRLNLDDFHLSDIDTKLGEILACYQSEQYKQHFGFLDYFRRLPSQSPLVDHLYDQVVDRMRERDQDIGFAAPDELEFYNPDYYELKHGRRSVIRTELSTEQVYSALDELDAWRDPLRSVRVTAFGATEPYDERRLLERYVVANVSAGPDHRDEEYALTAGAWFKVDQSYAERINRFMEHVEDITDERQLPVWDDEWLSANVEGPYPEARYNRHVSQSRGFALLDRNLYYGPTQTGQRVEICDLLTPDRQLICVKRLDGSDKMVQLFEQGMYSAGMMRDEAYRARTIRDFEAAGGSGGFGEPANWTYVFAIATSKPGQLADCLPFFSKVSLNANIDAITDKGFNVAIAKINRAA
jgi:uncharacterized protein (TIGR04141 family)